MHMHESHILIVDDDVTSRKVAESMLLRQGYGVVGVESGTQALVAMNQERYDIVLLDWIMPVLTGMELIARIRAGDAGKHHLDIPIIVVTADLMRCSKDICIAKGANDYIPKPVDFQFLIRTTARWLEYCGLHNF